MIDKRLKTILESLQRCQGVLRARLLTDEEKRHLLEVEAEAERRIILGMCPSLNLGVREALERPFTAAMVIQTSEFPYPHHPHMRIMLGDVVVGEQVLDRDRISELRKSRENVFLWENFVVYRSRLPRDPVERSRLRFVYLPRPFPALKGVGEAQDEVFGVPSPEGDRLVKNLLGETSTEVTLGTSLVGFSLRRLT
ncbi:MAG: hypothetical protein QW057_02060 [Candidatus Bathyarchaeia archaeon]